MEKQTFGGDWTEEKLTRVRKYLVAYSTILSKQPYFKYAYIDAFAGTGYRTLKNEDEQDTLLLPELVDQESKKVFRWLS
jgi:three-Cys-motif partner protein